MKAFCHKMYNKATQNPIVTIIIPTRNEEKYINRCLQSIFAMEPVKGGMEVLIVDGMSEDGTNQILLNWCRKQSNIKILKNPQKIVPAAMNIGIREARGNWIVRLDAHSEYATDYLKLCMETSQQRKADNVGGVLITLSNNNGFQSKIVQALTTHFFGVGDSTFRINAKERWVDTVPFGCYKREIFDKIGLYDERLLRNQDYELNRRLIKAGGRIWFNPKILIRYYNQSSLRGLFKQAFLTGKWNPWMWYIASYTFTWRHVIPSIFDLILIFSLLLYFINPFYSALTLKTTLIPYFLIASYASLMQALRYGKLIFPLLPFNFWIYHFVYGLGGIWGIILLLFKKAQVQEIPEP